MDTPRAPKDTPKPPNGRDIWNAIKEEMQNNLYPLPFSTIAPTLYHVYLHQADYDEIEGIVPRLVSELAKALTAEVQRMNEGQTGPGGRLWSLVRPEEGATSVEVPPSGWEIYIQPDHDGELERGTFGIVSKLMMPAPPSFAGTPTERIVRSVFTEGRRTKTMTNLEAPAPPAPIAQPPIPEAAKLSTPAPASAQVQAQAPAASSASSPAPPSPAPPSAPVLSLGPRAVLSYDDERGAHRFAVQKDLIKIGRGGDGAWVDVELTTSAHVSREHCWIVSDGSGHFFIQDVSTRGTSVNGERIPPPVRSAEGKVVEPGARRELADNARIALADTVTMQLQVAAVR